MRIGVFGGSIRPGGGLTVLKLVVDALKQDNELVVYTGAADSSQKLRSLFESNNNVTEAKFLHQASVFRRYAISKIAFMSEARRSKLDWVFSFNYHIPAPCRVAVYHINLLSFVRGSNEDFRKRIRDIDAQIACRRANLNLFASRYLLDAAMRSVGKSIRNSTLLYYPVDQDFCRTSGAGDSGAQCSERTNILCVTNNEPYKDNESVMKTLRILMDRRPEIKWTVSLAGGQSMEQWDGLKQYACALGVGNRVTFLGPIAKPELSALMASSLCLLNCSRIEAFCTGAIEAMASSCPVIVTTAAAMPESVGDAGITVAPGDCEAFAAAVMDFYDKPALRQRYVMLGRRRAEEFGVDEFGRRLRALLRRHRTG